MQSPLHFPASLSPSNNAALCYNKLTKPTTTQQPDPGPNPNPRPSTRCGIAAILAAISLILLTLAAATVTLAVVRAKRAGQGPVHMKPTKAIVRVCRLTQYPTLCVESLVGFPGATLATEQELVHIAMNVSLGKFSEALDSSSEMMIETDSDVVRNNTEMDSLEKAAFEDCVELLDHSVELIAHSLVTVREKDAGGIFNPDVGSRDDVLTWLSAAVTNQDTCTDGLDSASGPIKDHMAHTLQDLSELVSNSLSIYAATDSEAGDDRDDDVSSRMNRRLLGYGDYPSWLSKRDRVLLEMPSSGIQADVVVSLDGGNGTVKTIVEAIKMAPEKSKQRFIIYVKAGRYVETNLKVSRKKTNLWIIGDGKGQTIISGHRSVGQNRITTFRTASFAAIGTGFVAKDITFENEAGPEHHQAVALRVGADKAVIYHCEIKGYQDTLYAHTQRQFYRECDIYGTVDFIFGNAAAVFQNCTIYARKPMDNQKITITAQSRKRPMHTGFSIHECQIRAAPDLEPVKLSFSAYLGRPWKPLSRVVYMLSYISEIVDPAGWLEWNATSPIDKLFYGEYSNYGPGSGTGQRVQWPGVHSNMSEHEASLFTVEEFIQGSSWLTSTGVAFQAGLMG